MTAVKSADLSSDPLDFSDEICFTGGGRSAVECKGEAEQVQSRILLEIRSADPFLDIEDKGKNGTRQAGRMRERK